MFQGVVLEFYSAVHDIRGRSTNWQRLAVRSLPLAAAAAVGTGALCIRKRQDPPTKDFLGRHASFRCQGLQNNNEVEHSLEQLQVDVPALRRAARRMCGPIERDLMTAERAATTEGVARASAYSRLVEKWRAAGCLSEPLERDTRRLWKIGVDSVSLVDDSYGRDVGCEVPLCLLREKGDDELQSLGPEEWAGAANALETHGVALLHTLVPLSQVSALRNRLNVVASALDTSRAGNTSQTLVPIREYDCSPLLEEDPELMFVTSTSGRRHFSLRGRLLEDVVRQVQAGAMPLVWEHLDRVAAASSLPPRRRPYVSEVQLIISDPCAEDQFWHVDNTAPGLTLFVPLTDVPVEMGPTLFLPGSHHLFQQELGRFTRVRSFLASTLASDGVAVGAMGPGDALVYDSRIVHRGAANRKYNRTRVALIFRYDFERPPGMGPVGTQIMSWAGNALSCFQSFYATLPGSSAA